MAFSRVALAVALSLAAACGGGQAPASGSDSAPAPAAASGPAAAPGPTAVATTAAGIPEGLPTFATIGADGGSLASVDGRLTVSVPAGALTADTEVGIQPITATAPGALEPAYRLTPDGMVFATPVTLTFRYSEAEAAATAPDSRRIATQTPQGQWRVPKAVHDATARTLTVTTTHFSDWSYTSGEQLIPSSAVVMVGDELTVFARFCNQVDGAYPEPDAVLHECFGDLRWRNPTWSVNGISGGNATVGTVQSNPTAGFYKAPRAVPSTNPVAVAARFGNAGVITMVSNVTVVDAVREYSGRLSAQTRSPQGEMQLNADVRFSLVDQSDGSLSYTGTGRAYVQARLRGCKAGQGGGDMLPATAMVLDRSTAMITITMASAPTLNFTCNGAPVSGPMMMAPFVGPTPNCPTPQLTTGFSDLRGTWSCTMAAGMQTSANWTLRGSR